LTAESTSAALDDLIDAFLTGDSDRLAARYHDDIEWLFHAPISVFPFAGPRRGKTEVFKGFALLFESFQLIEYRVVLKLVDGDRAATLANSHMVQRATGRAIRSRIASFNRFQDGQLIEYRGFTDSFDAVEQVLGRWLEV
jgi:ketosteroid isomerase-like protein